MVERELKLSAGPGFQLPDLDGVLPGVEAEGPELLRMCPAASIASPGE